MKNFFLAPAIIVLIFVGCANEIPTPGITVMSIDWLPVATSASLPDGIDVWEGTDENLPLKAWMAKIDLKASNLDIEVLSSRDADGRQSASELAAESGACLLVNGGYFREEEGVYEHVGLLLADGEFVQFATPGIYKEDLRYDVHRAAIGFTRDNEPEIGWVSSIKDSVFVWDDPIANAPGVLGEWDYSEGNHLWDVTDAISGGPALMKDGRNRITIDEEIFFGTTIPDVHPRTAVGIGKDGELLLLVVDGRQRISRGVSLTELAGIMKSFGAVDALNLDGGGSSTFILEDELLNRPTGGTFQREIVSALAVHCDN